MSVTRTELRVSQPQNIGAGIPGEIAGSPAVCRVRILSGDDARRMTGRIETVVEIPTVAGVIYLSVSRLQAMIAATSPIVG